MKNEVNALPSSVNQKVEIRDPDPYQNVTDPEHCFYKSTICKSCSKILLVSSTIDSRCGREKINLLRRETNGVLRNPLT
jgi:hypothetical protein